MRPGPEVAAAVADAHRREWAFVLAAVVRVAGDIDRAEECVQDAYARALDTWDRTGVPKNSAAWLTTVARRKALDLLRRDATAHRALPDLAGHVLVAADPPEPESIPDDRLRLIFTCCHPALATEAQVALSLRLLCGMSTAEVASAFLVSEPTMAARITRAKKKIAGANIPYRIPPERELPERIRAVLEALHLLFTTGHTAPAGADLVRADLVDRAIALTRMLRELLPGDAEVAGLLALELLTDARRAGRVDSAGRQVLLEDQDRTSWDAAAIAEGTALVREALQRRPVGRYSVMAAIAAVHSEAPTWAATDWPEIVGLYDVLLHQWPSPIVALNRAVAIGFADGQAAGLAALDCLSDEPQLAAYGYLAAARAHFLAGLGRSQDARLAYDEALLLTENAAERDLLIRRLQELDR